VKRKARPISLLTRAYFDLFVEAGKIVLVIGSIADNEQIADDYEWARARGYVPYATTRPLDKLITNAVSSRTNGQTKKKSPDV
jgi:endo-alpha-1,4-polygalactosaminidase (GH114 family)